MILMKNKEYKDAWFDLKEELIRKYIAEKGVLKSLSKENTQDDFFIKRIMETKGKIKELENILMNMELKDNSNEYTNLLNDLYNLEDY